MLRKIWSVAKVEYLSFITGKKCLLMFFAFIFLAEDIVGKMGDLSVETGVQLNKLEPFLLLFSYSAHAMIVVVMFIVLLSDFPANRSSGIFIIARNTRKGWLIGEWLYSIMVGVTFITLLFVGSVLWLGKTGVWSSQWSSYMTSFSQQFPEEYTRNCQLFIEAGTVTQGKPMTVFVHTILLMLCYLFMMALVLSLFKILELKRMGLIVAIVITIIGAVAVELFGSAKWIFPMAHSIFGVHFIEFFREQECPLAYSYIYFGVINGVLLGVNLFFVKRMKIGDEQE